MERIGRLSASTLANYRTRLKKLWRIYPHIKDEKDKKMCMDEMLKLSDKTGLELGGPTLLTGSSPGRPRERYEFTAEDEALLNKPTQTSNPEDPSYWTPEALAGRAKARLENTTQEVDNSAFMLEQIKGLAEDERKRKEAKEQWEREHPEVHND